jgi:hypothetical protein
MAMQKFWMVYRLSGKNQARARVPRFKHPTLEAAKTEADRLAGLHPGIPFGIMELVGVACVAKPPKEQAVS